MPVSKISVLGVRSTNGGGSRWIGRRCVTLTGPRLSIGVAEQVEHAAERLLADGHRDRRARVFAIQTTSQTIGRTQRHRPHPSAAQVRRDLAGQIELHALFLVLDFDGVVDRGKLVFGELGVEGRADDLRVTFPVAGMKAPSQKDEG